MVELPEMLDKILKWAGAALALVGGIIAVFGIMQYVATVRMLSFITIFAGGFLIWMLFYMIPNASMAILGGVLAIIGGGILIFLRINEDFLEGGGV